MGNTPSQNDYTMGIENQNGTTGLQIFYDGSIDPTVHSIDSGFAIKFTTYTPQQSVMETPDVGSNDIAFSLRNGLVSSMTLDVALSLPSTEEVEMRIYDASGKMISSIRKTLPAGRHPLKIDISSLRSGVYFVYLKAGDRELSRKFAVLR